MSTPTTDRPAGLASDSARVPTMPSRSGPGSPGHPDVPEVAAAPHAGRSVFRLYVRLIRRAVLILMVVMAGYVALEVASYRSAYPDGISAEQFAIFEDSPAVRMVNGAPIALDTPAGFTVWDAGWIWQLILAVWAILTATRFLRGEEESDQADLVLAGPIRARRLTALILVAIALGGLLVGATVTVTMTAFGGEAVSSILLGLALAGVCATFAAVAGVTAQLVDVRRRAAGLAAAVLGIAWVVRMIGDSSDDLAWLRWFSPLGWIQELSLYGDPAPLALVPLLMAPVALTAVAVVLRARRDTGAALLITDSSRRARLGLLGSPLAFAWRSNRGVLLAWVIGLTAYAAVMGAVLTSMLDWLAGDEGYQRMLTEMGMADALSSKGFLAFMATVFGLAVALQVIWRLGAVWSEEQSGRLEAVLARPVARPGWLLGHALLAVLGGMLLILLGSTAQWLGAVAAGSTDITWWDSLRGMANTAPVVVLAAGLAVAAYGLLPRLTLAVPVAFIVTTYVLSMLGPALEWPQWVLDISPFTHLALVPAQPWAATSGLVMIGLAALLAAAGVIGFRRRDLTTP